MHSREELIKVLPVLKKNFEEIVDLVIEARLYQADHPEDGSLYDGLQSEMLRGELRRVYTLEGGRETIELAQREALLRLDIFEKQLMLGRRS